MVDVFSPRIAQNARSGEFFTEGKKGNEGFQYSVPSCPIHLGQEKTPLHSVCSVPSVVDFFHRAHCPYLIEIFHHSPAF